MTSYKGVIESACQTLRENTDENTHEERTAEADEMEDRFSYIFDSTKFVVCSNRIYMLLVTGILQCCLEQALIRITAVVVILEVF